jgi:hypothetical protein
MIGTRQRPNSPVLYFGDGGGAGDAADADDEADDDAILISPPPTPSTVEGSFATV